MMSLIKKEVIDADTCEKCKIGVGAQTAFHLLNLAINSENKEEIIKKIKEHIAEQTYKYFVESNNNNNNLINVDFADFASSVQTPFQQYR